MLLNNREYFAIDQSKRYFHETVAHLHAVGMWQRPNCCRSLNVPSIHQYYDTLQSCGFVPGKAVKRKKNIVFHSNLI